MVSPQRRRGRKGAFFFLFGERPKRNNPKPCGQKQKEQNYGHQSYLRLSGLKLGLLLNFNVPVMRDGIVRMAHKLED
jgi:hypothetical protein